MDSDAPELIDVPLRQLDEPLLDLLELVLGGLVSKTVLASRLTAERPEFPTAKSVPEGPEILADPDGTGLALVRWVRDDIPTPQPARISEVRALAAPEHGVFRTLRVTGSLGDVPVILFSQPPTLAELAELRALNMLLPDTVFLLVLSSPANEQGTTASQIQQLEHAAQLFTGVRARYVIVPAEVDPAELLKRISPRIIKDLRVTKPVRAVTSGTVIMFSGLSGSGKSTLARAVRQQLQVAQSQRPILLDGDDIRRFISKGLGFSREDRETNVERIGWIAARISESGGIAICAPIAPYATTRAAVRERALEVGNFLLIHISTPLEVCEARDRKGLYAKARAGLLKDFTGIDSPYEIPTDADLSLDLSKLSIAEATSRVMELLASETDS